MYQSFSPRLLLSFLQITPSMIFLRPQPIPRVSPSSFEQAKQFLFRGDVENYFGQLTGQEADYKSMERVLQRLTDLIHKAFDPNDGSGTKLSVSVIARGSFASRTALAGHEDLDVDIIFPDSFKPTTLKDPLREALGTDETNENILFEKDKLKNVLVALWSQIKEHEAGWLKLDKELEKITRSIPLRVASRHETLQKVLSEETTQVTAEKFGVSQNIFNALETSSADDLRETLQPAIGLRLSDALRDDTDESLFEIIESEVGEEFCRGLRERFPDHTCELPREVISKELDALLRHKSMEPLGTELGTQMREELEGGLSEKLLQELSKELPQIPIDLFLKVRTKVRGQDVIIGLDKDSPAGIRRYQTTTFVPTEALWLGDRRLSPVERTAILSLKWWKNEIKENKGNKLFVIKNRKNLLSGSPDSFSASEVQIKSHHFLVALNAMHELDTSDDLYIPRHVSQPFTMERLLEVMVKILTFLDRAYHPATTATVWPWPGVELNYDYIFPLVCYIHKPSSRLLLTRLTLFA